MGFALETGGGTHPVRTAALAILFVILAMSAVLDKSFCSHLCPVGALSEWLGRLGAQFTLWAFAHIGGRAPVVPRPAGVEGFLPISALMSMRLWLAGGGIHPVRPAGLVFLLAIVAMSAVLAKSFCSHLCPVGAASEWLGRFGTRLLGRTWQPPRWLDLPRRSLKYLLLAFFVWATWVR